ncbi:hypothetical protein PUN28_015683 [Cardiocondyla obscurior]|uniref:Uncharacterized protein n=1 Tax=Cardiocondyla obscurior TaxID=286306 RepID=A0AAW2EY37_9HYME
MDKIITGTGNKRARKAKERSDGCRGVREAAPINYTTISLSPSAKYPFDTMPFSNHRNTYKVASNLSNPTTLRNVSASPLSFLSLILFSVPFPPPSHPSLPSSSLTPVLSVFPLAVGARGGCRG